MASRMPRKSKPNPSPAPREEADRWRERAARAGRRSPAPSPTPREGASAAEVQTRCGFVALTGAPNAGKSALMNQLVGHKLAIVTPKVQKTRTRLLGIANQ